ncbi:MAG: PAS domain-containing protein [Candidatus Melainabacteria bacterium]|nr:PAS domain-containing protein [Candidatus Melainabacteria bacterium]
MKFLVIVLKSDDRTTIKNALNSIPGLDVELQFSGHSVEGLFKIRSFQPDVVLVDEIGLESTMLTQLRQSKAEALIYVVVEAQSDLRACALIRKGATDMLLRDQLGTEAFTSTISRAIERIRMSGQFQSNELGKANARLFNVANALSTLSWIADESGERILFNDKWLKFTGRELEQELGKKWTESVHPQDLKKFWSLYTSAIKERKPYHVEYRLKTADGQFRLVWESGTPQLRADGSFIGMSGSCADISETIFTQEHLPVVFEPLGTSTTLDHVPIGVWKLDSNLVITKANPAVATLFSVPPEHLVGRTFTTVVSSIPDNTFVRVLKNGERIKLENHPVTLALDEKRRKVFLDFAAWPLKDKANNVVGVCVSTTEVTERLLADQQRDDFVATLVHDLGNGMIIGDRLSIRRVILNLLDNALKFTPKDGLIEVSADEEDGDIIFRVSDTGVGIPQSEFAQVFLRYWQGDSAKRFTPGTGLGLYLCRQIVTAHGGTISVLSKMDEGTTFTVVMPKQPPPQ